MGERGTGDNSYYFVVNVMLYPDMMVCCLTCACEFEFCEQIMMSEAGGDLWTTSQIAKDDSDTVMLCI